MRIITCFICFLPFNYIKIFLLRCLGHKVSFSSKIGVSFIWVNKIEIKSKARIKNFSYIKVNDLKLFEDSFIGSLNYINGPIDIFLERKAGISTQNKIRRSYSPISYGTSELYLGYNSFIVSNHFLDLTRSVCIGKNSIIAGIQSQLWTHGYYHSDNDEDRIRVDGPILIGDNVYIGSNCIFNPGIKISNSIHVGAGSIISKNLVNSGMYVSQQLRYIDNNIEKVKSKLKIVKGFDLIETVYEKDKSL